MKRIYIKEEKTWNDCDLREMCIRHNLFDNGSNTEYYQAFDFVRDNEPNIDNIYMLAKFILENTSDNTLKNIMFLISNDLVKTFYEEVSSDCKHDLEIAEYYIK